jgi:hypothetical protein
VEKKTYIDGRVGATFTVEIGEVVAAAIKRGHGGRRRQERGFGDSG